MSEAEATRIEARLAALAGEVRQGFGQIVETIQGLAAHPPGPSRVPSRRSARDCLLTGRQLALALGRSHTYVSAMKRAGYEFTSAGRTTLGSARAWLDAHPDFRTTQVRGAARLRHVAVQPSPPADKCGESS